MREKAVIVDEPLLPEKVIIERVLMDRGIDHPLQVRQEGDAIIILVVEEVVEKRLKLAEELRITKQQATKRQPQAITLRRQSVAVERLRGSDDGKLD